MVKKLLCFFLLLSIVILFTFEGFCKAGGGDTSEAPSPKPNIYDLIKTAQKRARELAEMTTVDRVANNLLIVQNSEEVRFLVKSTMAAHNISYRADYENMMLHTYNANGNIGNTNEYVTMYTKSDEDRIVDIETTEVTFSALKRNIGGNLKTLPIWP